MKFSLREICVAVGGILYGRISADTHVKAVSIDSREDLANKLFIPITGLVFDGHNYVKEAVSKGAVCALTEKTSKMESVPVIKVSSTRQALLDLANYDRARFKGPVVAITGSVGKTTTKEMIASVLSQKYNTLKTQGNFNNDIGLPLTLLSREECHEAMVLEMGMNHLGEIRVLSKIGKPDICLITNIGDAHIENLGSREGILQAKSEIFEGMAKGGTVILNGDDPLLSALPKVSHAKKTIYCYISCESEKTSRFKENKVYAENIRLLGLKGTYCDIVWHMEGIADTASSIEIYIPLPGKHMIMNALMSFALGLELGLTSKEIAEGIKDFAPTGDRMAITKAGVITIINDAYNASPYAMKAAVDMLSSADGRKVCIFGDMFELGSCAKSLHKEVGQYMAEKKMDLLIAIGLLSKHMYEAFLDYKSPTKQQALYFKTKEEFLAQWRNHLQPGDTVLIKASRRMALEVIAKEIILNPL